MLATTGLRIVETIALIISETSPPPMLCLRCTAKTVGIAIMTGLETLGVSTIEITKRPEPRLSHTIIVRMQSKEPGTKKIDATMRGTTAARERTVTEMYEELITNLRNCATVNSLSRYKRDLMKQAADAIENTSKAYRMMAEAYEAEVTQSRWIPVTESLPEELFVVLCYCSRNGQCECGEWTLDDHNRVCWIGLNGMIPTHWMPLPQPPEEETE